MNDYTPSTDTVRACYVYSSLAPVPERDPAFDSWLRSIKAEAWDECVDAVDEKTRTTNPYRSDLA